MNNDTTILVKTLGKSFGSLEILKDINFDVKKGEIVCIWGPSGAGKSTLLHILGLMTPPTTGDYVLYGERPYDKPEKDQAFFRNQKIGFLFQFHHLLPDLTILENVMVPLLIRKISKEKAEEKAKPFLERLGLKHRLGHRPYETSGGEQQRAALARSLVGDPGVILADEPTGNLDRGIGQEVEFILKEEVKNRNASLVLVTHNETLASQADRRLILVDGKLKKD